ncbi:MAG TPA: DUF2905 domain-containing protein [Bacteroidia bacterium]|jgi:hypothetical protein|nr:DUF2905 domain-containing protein [Bacteroidia bacterium]
MPSITKYLLIAGALLMLAGLAWWLFGNKLKWLGKLPGDIRIEGSNGGFYFPIVTCILISIVVSLLLWLIRKFM